CVARVSAPQILDEKNKSFDDGGYRTFIASLVDLALKTYDSLTESKNEQEIFEKEIFQIFNKDIDSYTPDFKVFTLSVDVWNHCLLNLNGFIALSFIRDFGYL
nr:hypothetical protein [Tanacetum cinerariifolium]